MAAFAAIAMTTFAEGANAQAPDAGPWGPEQFTSSDYFFSRVTAVGHALQVDWPMSLQCDTIMYARQKAASGAERLLDGAIWTAFIVRGGDLRSSGATVTSEEDQQIRIPITPNGLDTPLARAFFERMRATPGGLEARTAECVTAFDAVAGPSRAYFEQRAAYVAGNP